MAIQVSGTEVISNSRALNNIASVDATTAASITAAGVGGGGFEPVAVTGTTPSLDVGSYNFFDNGTLTADTTVSFASVPTNANWQYSFKSAIASGDWNISTAVYLQLFSVAGQDTQPTGVFFKPDGLKMYVVGNYGDNVYEYDLGIVTAITLPAAVVGAPSAIGVGDRVTYDFFTMDGGTTVNLIGEEII